jgi:WhiB family transcriptional regulator, redox-sensing transcriptional regulator
VSDFIESIFGIGGIPSMPKALCRDRWDLFDADGGIQAAQAMALCDRCPERRPCADWLATMPPNSVSGVCAGAVQPWSPRAPRRAS